MKFRNWYYLLSVVCFTLLFYKQLPGINVLLFAGLLLSASVLMNTKVCKTKQWLTIAAGTLFSSFFVAIYANSLTIMMSLISMIILMVIQKSKNTSYGVALGGGIISVFGSVIFMILGINNAQRLKKAQKTQSLKKTNKLGPVFVVVVVSFLFLSLYREVNPIFDAYFASLLGNIEWGWIFFTLFGSAILYSFFFPPRLLMKLLKIENSYGKTIGENYPKPKFSFSINLFANFENERYSALLMFGILNLLLLFLNLIDFNYLFLKGELPKGITYSDYVHSGVGAIIVSIILAIALIIYYFRGQINFDPKSKIIKTLVYFWIAQNMILILMAAFKNQLYIEAYSLTFLRIGVYYYLGFSILGLLLTLYKIYYQKDTWFLFRSNPFGFYILLVLSCAINWGTLVTNYNLINSKEVDLDYIESIGFENYPLLWERQYFESKEHATFELRLTSKPEYYDLPNAVGLILEDYEKTGFVSYSYEMDKTYRYFVQLAGSGKLKPGTEKENWK
ncbi:MAG: DUF4173 domain-containing protein [Mariniphaga sp.]